MARVIEMDARARGGQRGSAVVPDRVHGKARRGVGDRDIGAELIHRQALDEIGGLGGGNVEKIPRLRTDDEEIEQDFALRRQQPRKARFARVQPLDFVGDEALQQFFAVGAIDANDAAVGKSRDLYAGH